MWWVVGLLGAEWVAPILKHSQCDIFIPISAGIISQSTWGYQMSHSIWVNHLSMEWHSHLTCSVQTDSSCFSVKMTATANLYFCFPPLTLNLIFVFAHWKHCSRWTTSFTAFPWLITQLPIQLTGLIWHIWSSWIGPFIFLVFFFVSGEKCNKHILKYSTLVVVTHAAP